MSMLPIVIFAGVVWLLWRLTRRRDVRAVLPAPRPVGGRARLTDAQMMALSCASFDLPIYGERPSMMFAQMPNDRPCFDVRTVRSLESRGFLRSDGAGGYLLTEEGAGALKAAMGF